MSSSLSFDSTTNELPTLVRMASIVLNKCAEEQADFGDNVRFDLVKPILELASANLLARVEAACPRIELNTEYIWKAQCTRQFSVLMREYDTDTWEGSRPWKNAFFQCKQEEALRLKQLSSKIRNQRQDLEDRKRDKKVKFTDREPPTKKQRMSGSWGGPTAPKTLFQKTRSDTTKLQKNLYTRKAAPPKPRPISAFAASASNHSTASGKTYSTGSGSSSTCSSASSSSSTFSGASSSSMGGSSSRSIGSVLGASSRALIWDSAPQRTATTTPTLATTTATSSSTTATSAPTTTGVTVRTVVRRPAPGPSAVPQHIPKLKTSPTQPQPSPVTGPASPSKLGVRNSSGVPALSDSPFDRGVPSSSPASDLKTGTSSPSVSSPKLPRPKKTAMSSMFLPSKRAAVKS